MDVTIRRAEVADAEAAAAIYASPGAQSGTLQMPFPSVEAWRKRFQADPNTTSLVAVVDGQVVGNIGLVIWQLERRRHAAYLGMAVRDDYQGKGIGKRLMEAVLEIADRWLDLERIELHVFADNTPAIHLYEKFGFVKEGTMTRFAFRNGEYVDGIAMARLRDRGV